MDKNDQLFFQLIYIFQASAMQALGKIKNPVTDAIERDLPQANQAIEMLEMIREKTKNNISKDMERLLDTSISELKLNYVDEVNKQS
ncbi:MAG: DUF1844 domain-containing protein [Bacteroidota bacterium]|jgi:hypothetical protein